MIVGGVAAGASAAARARRLSEHAEIVLIERGPDISFANCGMPYHIGEKIEHRERLLVVRPQLLRERFRIDVRTSHEVTALDPRSKQLRVTDLQRGEEYTLDYDQLLLTPGAAPFVPNIPGVDLPHVETLRNLGDMDRIKARVDRGLSRALIIGAGFIGLELVENLVHRGVSTTLIERGSQIMPPMDAEMTAPLLEVLETHGVDVRLGTEAVRFEPCENGVRAVLSSGAELEVGLVVLGTGVRPENALAAQAGLELGPRGGIKVDRQMRTSVPDIFAAGDVVETYEAITETPIQVPLAGPANRQGRIAADAMFEREASFRGSQCTAILGLFDRVAAMTGFSEKDARRRGLRVGTAVVHPAHHASYYPGAKPMTLKLVYDAESGRVLGAAGVGSEGVDKRIDVLAVAVQAQFTVFQLEELELCYAPQFGSAKDPVNMLGFVAAGQMRGDHPQISAAEVASRVESGECLLVDVRTPHEFAAGSIESAINIPLDELRERLGELPRDRRLVAFCKVGQRGYIATRILLQHGFNAVNLSGGYTSWALHTATQPLSVS